MYRGDTIGVVVPAYNEEKFIGDVIDDLPEYIDAIYLIDDASTDGTWQAMGDAMGAQRDEQYTAAMQSTVVDTKDYLLSGRIADSETVGNMTRLRHSENRGAGGAIKTGYLAGLEDSVDVIATIDGDGQMDSDQLSSVLDPIVTNQVGYAKGNRFAEAESLREMPAFRLFGNVLLTGLTRIASGYWRLSDPQNGFTAISRSALLEIDVDELWEYYGYMNQLMARLNAANVQIADVEMSATYGEEESTIEYPQYIRRVSVLLLVSFIRRLWTKYVSLTPHPVVICYGISVLFVVGSVIRILLLMTTDRDVSWQSTKKELIVGVGAFVMAAAIEKYTQPSVVSKRSELGNRPSGGDK